MICSCCHKDKGKRIFKLGLTDVDYLLITYWVCKNCYEKLEHWKMTQLESHEITKQVIEGVRPNIENTARKVFSDLAQPQIEQCKSETKTWCIATIMLVITILTIFFICIK